MSAAFVILMGKHSIKISPMDLLFETHIHDF